STLSASSPPSLSPSLSLALSLSVPFFSLFSHLLAFMLTGLFIRLFVLFFLSSSILSNAHCGFDTYANEAASLFNPFHPSVQKATKKRQRYRKKDRKIVCCSRKWQHVFRYFCVCLSVIHISTTQ